MTQALMVYLGELIENKPHMITYENNLYLI
jgi:hypothetical protein